MTAWVIKLLLQQYVQSAWQRRLLLRLLLLLRILPLSLLLPLLVLCWCCCVNVFLYSTSDYNNS